MTVTIDPKLFLETSIAEETRLFNQDIVSQMQDAPDMWSFPASQVRQARMEGVGPFPLEPEEPTAHDLSVDTPNGPLGLRLFRPKSSQAKGSYLHIHGGGWVLGSTRLHDSRLQEISDNCSLNCISVDYRLAPENPYPAGPDDCEQAALWLLNGNHKLDISYLALGGESAGAHLSVVTLLRLRDRFGQCPFHAANLVAGVYDLGQTASARNWGSHRLILTSRDIQMFAARFVQSARDLRDADISPLFANLDNLPPALFSVGTKDLLLDDSLQMAGLWHSRNGNAQLDVTPGGCHVFQGFTQLAIARASNTRIETFLKAKRETTLEASH